MNNLINSILRSCIDFKFYKEIFYQPFGKTLRYLLVLALLATLVLSVRYSIVFNKFSKKTLAWILENVPYIEITDGVVTADVQQPFTIVEEGFAVIIDTAENTKEIDPRYESGVLLTKNKLIFKQSRVQTQEFDLAKVKKFRLDKETLGKWRMFFIGIILPFMMIMQFFYFFIVKIIQALIAGLIVLIFRSQDRYSNAVNVCVYALTPPTLFALFVMLIYPKPLVFFPLIYIGMYIAFIVGGIRQIQPEPQPQ